MKRILVILVLAAVLAAPEMTSAAGQAPAGFIALSESSMNWREAVAYCKQQGGRLARINDSDAWAWADRDKLTRIDGFIARGAHWPTGLPSDFYWAGTEFSGKPGVAFHVGDRVGFVSVYGAYQRDTYRVVCVP